MSMAAIGVGLGGAALSYIGQKDANESNREMFDESRELPEWLKPYYLGEAGPAPEPTPVNYNWLDALAAASQTGMPQQMPPMSMNDPRMTFQNVHTPVQGGPWGYGMGPGQLTAEAGIPGGPGQQFIPPGEGFQPGPTGPQAPPGPEGGGGAMDQDMLDRARRYLNASRPVGGGPAWEHGGQDVSTLQALQWAARNPEASDRDIYRMGILAPYGGR